MAQRPGDIDVVYAYGHGFPTSRGGPMHYADTVGLDRMLPRINEFRERFGEATWAQAPLLELLAAQGTAIELFETSADKG